MNPDPELDNFICKHCGITPPLTFAKLQSACRARGLALQKYHLPSGKRYVLNHLDPQIFFKTKTAAYREGLIRWIHANNSRRSTDNHRLS